ncbi:methionyl-tRNA formyltransferase [Alphaproteobacteria bacterium]|nr:methionyl-tRNA formyltransferase [Alphaproteobacteria bacterium]
MGLRVVFMGTPDFAVPAFRAILDAGHEIVGVYTRPAAKSGRGMKLTASPVEVCAQAAGLRVFTPSTLKTPESLQEFADLAPDLAVVVAYGMILPQAWLDVPALGCWNIHASLLPRWRGAAPIQRAIMAGDAQTGAAIMQMQAGLDTGPVLVSKSLPIAKDDSAQTLHDKLAILGGEALRQALDQAGKLQAQPQSEIGITYAEKIDKAEARIDWQLSAQQLDAHIRGLSPFPGAWFEVDETRVKILQARPIDAASLETQGPAGQVAEKGAVIYCGDGALELLQVQRAGKAAMPAVEFMRAGLLPAGKNL